MTEEEMEMQAEKREKDLIARTGRSRTAQGTWMPTKERMKEMTGEVKTWPALPGLKYRIAFIAKGMTQVEFAKKCGISDMTASRLYHGKTVRESTLKGVAIAFGAPFEWLRGAEKEETRGGGTMQEHKRTDEVQNGILIHMAGDMTGDKIKRLLGALLDEDTYKVDISVKGE